MSITFNINVNINMSMNIINDINVSIDIKVTMNVKWNTYIIMNERLKQMSIGISKSICTYNKIAVHSNIKIVTAVISKLFVVA